MAHVIAFLSELIIESLIDNDSIGVAELFLQGVHVSKHVLNRTSNDRSHPNLFKQCCRYFDISSVLIRTSYLTPYDEPLPGYALAKKKPADRLR
jgi:hypothetical protein